MPGGAFDMGCFRDPEHDCGGDAAPRHTVSLDGFLIDRTEVTVAAYRRCSDAGACKTDGITTQTDMGGHPAECNGRRSDRDDHPINCVTWTDADSFCKWADKRLPTEAEWEKAAGGTERRSFPWGNDGPDGREDLVVILRLHGKSAPRGERSPKYVNTTWPVGGKPAGASPYGALDMLGNVWEWTADWYDAAYYARSPSANPQGPEQGSFRVMRGDVDEAFMRVQNRAKLAPTSRLGVLGFRCARSVPR
ncbi:MAG: SUMF1/EgtB/PvdO family nonheme iron enzyme [Polyangiaceae bacterium]|nr:SUMF1/EgtB/PvdO family nonheme iron enzyme [Polyangiaceae bacterium]